MTGRDVYIAENGVEITDDVVNRWADEVEDGFPNAEVIPFEGRAWEVDTEPLKPHNGSRQRHHVASDRAGRRTPTHERQCVDQSSTDGPSHASDRHLTGQQRRFPGTVKGLSNRDRDLLTRFGMTGEQVERDEIMAESEIEPDDLNGRVYYRLHLDNPDEEMIV